MPYCGWKGYLDSGNVKARAIPAYTEEELLNEWPAFRFIVEKYRDQIPYALESARLVAQTREDLLCIYRTNNIYIPTAYPYEKYLRNCNIDLGAGGQPIVYNTNGEQAAARIRNAIIDRSYGYFQACQRMNAIERHHGYSRNHPMEYFGPTWWPSYKFASAQVQADWKAQYDKEHATYVVKLADDVYYNHNQIGTALSTYIPIFNNYYSVTGGSGNITGARFAFEVRNSVWNLETIEARAPKDSNFRDWTVQDVSTYYCLLEQQKQSYLLGQYPYDKAQGQAIFDAILFFESGKSPSRKAIWDYYQKYGNEVEQLSKALDGAMKIAQTAGANARANFILFNDKILQPFLKVGAVISEFMKIGVIIAGAVTGGILLAPVAASAGITGAATIGGATVSTAGAAVGTAVGKVVATGEIPFSDALGIAGDAAKTLTPKLGVDVSFLDDIKKGAEDLLSNVSTAGIGATVAAVTTGAAKLSVGDVIGAAQDAFFKTAPADIIAGLSKTVPAPVVPTPTTVDSVVQTAAVPVGALVALGLVLYFSMRK